MLHENKKRKKRTVVLECEISRIIGFACELGPSYS